MVAGLFARHGLWVGRTVSRGDNPLGTYEGIAIGQVLDEHFEPGRVARGLSVARSIAPGEFRAALRRDGYTAGRWLWKGSAVYWKAFERLRPVYITVRRNEKSIVASARATRLLGAYPALAATRHRRILDELENAGMPRIDAEPLIRRDYRQIETVFDRCGIEFDSTIADDWIRPDLWHY